MGRARTTNLRNSTRAIENSNLETSESHLTTNITTAKMAEVTLRTRKFIRNPLLGRVSFLPFSLLFPICENCLRVTGELTNLQKQMIVYGISALPQLPRE